MLECNRNHGLRNMNRLTLSSLAIATAAFAVTAPAHAKSNPPTTSCAGAWSTKLNGADSAPQNLALVAAGYPRRANHDDIGGLVVQILDISASGEVSNLAILCTERPGYFESYVAKTLKKWTFVPATEGGQPVAFSSLVITLEFDPNLLTGPTILSHPVAP